MTHTTTEFEKKLESQVNLSKDGIYEVFVNEGELRAYWNLEGNLNSPMMKKCFAPVFNGKILSISFERSRAIRNLLDEANVETLAEFER